MTSVKKPVGTPTRPSGKTESWYVREDVIDLLGISENTLMNWMRKGMVKPIRELRVCKDGREREVWIYDPKELTKLPMRHRNAREVPTAGEVAAKAFELFTDGAKQRDAVIATRAEPERIRELYETWLEMGGADFVITPAARVDLEQLLGPITDVAELVQKVRARIEPPAPDDPGVIAVLAPSP